VRLDGKIRRVLKVKRAAVDAVITLSPLVTTVTNVTSVTGAAV